MLNEVQGSRREKVKNMNFKKNVSVEPPRLFVTWGEGVGK